MKISEKIIQKRFLIFAVAIVLALIFWSSVSIQKIFFDYAEIIEKIFFSNKILGLAIFTGLAILSALLSPFSIIPFVPVAVMVWGNLPTAFMLVLGWLLGDAFAYLIGSSAGYAALKHFLPIEKAEYYKNKIPSHSQFWIILIFRLALPSEITGYAIGIIKYDFTKYLLASFLAEFPFALITTYSSEALINRQPIIFLSAIAAAIAIIWTTFYVFRKKIK